MSQNRRWINTRVEYQWVGEELVEISREGYWYEGELALAHNTPNLDQDSYAFYNDGTESGSTIIGTANNPQTLDSDTTYLVRFLIQEDNGGASNNFSSQLEYDVNNSGTFTSVTSTSNFVRAVVSSNLGTDGSDTTQRIGAGTFISPNAGVDNGDGAAGTTSFAGNDEFEAVFAIQFRNADLTDQDTVQLRVASMNTYTNTASATINVSLPVITGTLAVTESGSDTSATSGTVAISGSAAATESGSDTSTTSGTVAVSGSLAVTETGSDTSAITGVVTSNDTLNAEDILSASTVTQPSVTQTQPILAEDVTSSSETFTATLIQNHIIDAIDVSSASSVTTASLTQNHLLDAVDVSSTSTVTQPNLSSNSTTDDLLADDISSNSTVTSAAFNQTQNFNAIDVTSSSSVSAPNYQEEFILLAEDIVSASTVSQPNLTESNNLNPLLAEDINSASNVSDGIFGQTSILNAENVSALTSVSTVNLSELINLLAEDVNSASTTSTVGLTNFKEAYVKLSLVNRKGKTQNNLPAIHWAWFDDIDPLSVGAPSCTGTEPTPNATLTLDVSATTLNKGEYGTLLMRTVNGALIGAYNIQVT